MKKRQKFKDWTKRNKHLIVGASLATAGAVLGVAVYRSVSTTVEEQSKYAAEMMRWMNENNAPFDHKTKIIIVPN